MLIGYARVSTQEQNLNLQIDALKAAGCGKIFEEYISGTKSDRPVFNQLLEQLREGDTLVVWKLDRLGRSVAGLVNLVNEFATKKVGLKSLNDPIDTTTSQGRFIFNIFASLAELEKDMIRERTKAGLAAARSRGRLGGRPKGLSKEAKVKAHAAKSLYKEQKLSVRQIAKELQIGLATLYKYLKS